MLSCPPGDSSGMCVLNCVVIRVEALVLNSLREMHHMLTCNLKEERLTLSSEPGGRRGFKSHKSHTHLM